MPIMEPLNPLKCYCGQPAQLFDITFKRNFCSQQCLDDLTLFCGGEPKAYNIVTELRAGVLPKSEKVEPTRAGDFNIRGGVVTLHSELQKHQQSKVSTIDKIDAQVTEQFDRDRERDRKRKELKKIGIPDNVIEEMLKCQ